MTDVLLVVDKRTTEAGWNVLSTPIITKKFLPSPHPLLFTLGM